MNIIDIAKAVSESAKHRMIGIRPGEKIHEEMIRGKVSDLLSYFTERTPRGEFVIMIGKDDPNVFF